MTIVATGKDNDVGVLGHGLFGKGMRKGCNAFGEQRGSGNAHSALNGVDEISEI